MALSIINAIISKGTSLSNPVQITGGAATRLIIPTPFDNPGVITFQTSPDGSNYYDMFDGNIGEVTMKVMPGVIVWLGTERFSINNTYLKIRSGTRDAPANQSADRMFQIVIDPNWVK